MGPDYEKIKEAAQNYGKDMCAFLREMISHPSESCEEKEVVECIRREMEKVGFDKVEVDGLGNVIGWMGEGDRIIALAIAMRLSSPPESFPGFSSASCAIYSTSISSPARARTFSSGISVFLILQGRSIFSSTVRDEIALVPCGI